MFHFPAYPPQTFLRCRPTTAGGLPHSDTLGSKPCRRLPEAYRGPTRPSSVLPAKASTIRPWQQTHQPRKKGATGPCHLHWNTLRQLIRSSKHHPHQQCGRLTKTLANTIQHPQPNRRGTERFDKINSTNTPGTPHKGTPFMLASTLQFSNHHTTPPQTPTPHRGTARTAGTEHHPRQGAWRSGNPTACTTPPPGARRHPPRFFSSQQGTPPGQEARL